ncbi:MAG: hypothetical protein NWE93_00545 [Candidatus Bathyarchaeota archaeon]|nr:hypothetical protein [Candidatus Bathyarchaeota archaeon]
MPISAHPFDMYVWYLLSERILQEGPLALVGFPPLWYHYMMVPIAYGYSGLSGVLPTGTIAMSSLPSALNFYPSYSVTVVPGLLFDFVVKVPFLVSDVLLALLLYKLVAKVSGKAGLGVAAAALWFLNPYVIWVSAGWGMWDTLPALFSLATLYFLLERRLGWAAVCLSLAVALKLYPLLFLVPIAFYLYKSASPTKRWRSSRSFFSVFFACSLLIFLPYLGAAGTFISDFFLLGGAGGLGTVTPLGPLSFGLTYWSFAAGLEGWALGSLLVSVSSLVLAVAVLLWVYWRISRMVFVLPAYALSVAMLFCVAAFFLTYRIVSEQWVIWLLPFLIVTCTVGGVKKTFYWVLSLLALSYALLNCPLPFYFLPLAPWASGALLGGVYFFWWIEPLRVWALAALAVAFSAVLLLLVYRLNRARLL